MDILYFLLLVFTRLYFISFYLSFFGVFEFPYYRFSSFHNSRVFHTAIIIIIDVTFYDQFLITASIVSCRNCMIKVLIIAVVITIIISFFPFCLVPF